MRIAFLLILVKTLAGSCIPTYKNSVALQTLPADKQVTGIIHIKNLYLAASGNISTRVVASNLYTALQQEMQKTGLPSILDLQTPLMIAMLRML